MKKALALILAVLMICPIVATCISAEGATTIGEQGAAIDMKELYDSHGYASTYVGAPLSAEAPKPVRDGVVSNGEYQVQYVISSGSSDAMNGSTGYQATAGGVNYTEYVSHDENYLYFAATFQENVWNKVFTWNILKSNSYVFNYDSRHDSVTHAGMFTQNNGTIKRTSVVGFGPRYTAEDGVNHHNTTADALAVWDDGTNIDFIVKINESTKIKTYEYRISKEWLAPLVGVDSPADIKNLSWTTWSHGMGIYFRHELSGKDKAVLKNLVGGDYTHTDDGFFRFFILDEEPDGYTEMVAKNRSAVMEDVTRDLGLHINLSAKIETAPTIDGVVSEGEYNYTYTNTWSVATDGPEVQSPVVEYLAYDDDFVYYAATFKQRNDNRSYQFFWNPFNNFGVFQHVTGTDTSWYQKINTHMRYVNAETPNKLMQDIKLNYNNGWPAPALDTEVDFDVTKITASGSNQNLKTYETKMSLDYIAKISGCSKEDVRVIPYYTYVQTSGAGGHSYTTKDIATLRDAGAKWTPSVGEWGYKFIVLNSNEENINEGYEPVTEDPKWETLAETTGLKISVPPVTATPTIDGVISDDEYPANRTTAVADLSAGAGSPITTKDKDGNTITLSESELQGETVTEYFGHDAEYIYYAISFTQEEDNRACWPRFKVGNTFNVYNSNYSLHVAYQARYTWDDKTQTHSYYVNGITGQGGLAAPVDGEDMIFAADKNRETNLKTYEFRIDKSYFTSFKNTNVEDVRVIPYYTWFHSSTALGNIMTAEQNAAITEAGGTAPAVGALSYRFMVLEGETVNVEDRITITTNETASIRLSPSNAGIRFKSNVNAADLATLVEKFGADNVKIGTLITLEEILGENELTADATFQTVDVAATVASPFASADGVNTYAGSLTNLNPNNFAKNFAARGYIAYRADAESEWTYIYSDVTALRSAAYVANQALESGKYAEDAAALAILNAYAAAQAN